MNDQIRLSDISKVYHVPGGENICALSDINLLVRGGEKIAITGNSGSGKTTLMNIIGCVFRPTNGRYYYMGRNILTDSNRKHAIFRNSIIGFVFQDYQLLPDYSVYENVELPLIIGKKSYKKNDINAVLERLNILELAKRNARSLSGGQAQKVAIARAIVNNPDVILADEPTGALNSADSDEIVRLLFDEIGKEKTVIVSTHNDSIAKRAERKIVLRDGAIIEDYR